ncbi:MAG TPA: DinB family protein [Candidatus Acidoferrum sp.]|nr:DinB family protein [Candidatus Acidoferrum sp.]
MRRFLGSFILLALSPALSFAQATPAPAPSTTPVADALRAGLARYSKNMSAAADAMPADKFSFKPTPDQSSFAHLTIHIAESNTLFCSKVSGIAAPDGPKLAETDSKDKLVAAVKTSFDFCSTALAKLDDSHLTDQIPLFSGRSFSRAGVMFILSGSWADHYSAQSMYLRLNGVLPPSAQPAVH